MSVPIFPSLGGNGNQLFTISSSVSSTGTSLFGPKLITVGSNIRIYSPDLSIVVDDNGIGIFGSGGSGIGPTGPTGPGINVLNALGGLIGYDGVAPSQLAPVFDGTYTPILQTDNSQTLGLRWSTDLSLTSLSIGGTSLPYVSANINVPIDTTGTSIITAAPPSVLGLLSRTGNIVCMSIAGLSVVSNVNGGQSIAFQLPPSLSAHYPISIVRGLTGDGSFPTSILTIDVSTTGRVTIYVVSSSVSGVNYTVNPFTITWGL